MNMSPKWFALLGIVLGASILLVQARDLAVDEDELVAVELATVGMVPLTGTPVVLLREPTTGSVVPIFIGHNEAQAIVMAQRRIETPRPMTHDLTRDLIAALGGELKRVIVDELRDGTYLGVLELAVPGSDQPVRVDTRPSDGLALAVRTGAEILVAPAILEAGEDIPFEGLGDEHDVVTALGITVMAVSDELRQALDLPDQPGVLVSATRSLAAMAGIQPGAMILKVNGQEVDSPMAFLDRVNETPADEKAQLVYWHLGERHELALDTDVPAATPRRERRDRI